MIQREQELLKKYLIGKVKDKDLSQEQIKIGIDPVRDLRIASSVLTIK